MTSSGGREELEKKLDETLEEAEGLVQAKQLNEKNPRTKKRRGNLIFIKTSNGTILIIFGLRINFCYYVVVLFAAKKAERRGGPRLVYNFYMKCVDLVSVNPQAGITLAKPCKCVATDGEYFVKFKESPAGPRELVNEFVGYSLAGLLSLPIPEPALLRIPDSLPPIDFGDPVKTAISSHFAFGSTAIPKAVSLSVDPSRFLVSCSNPQDLLPIILFDALIENVDRDSNGGNALYEINSRIIYIIDQGNIFGAGDIWDENTLLEHGNRALSFEFSPKGIYQAMFESYDLKRYKGATAKRFQKLTKRSFSDILRELPEEWNCSLEEQRALDDYLQKRFVAYNKMLELILRAGERQE